MSRWVGAVNLALLALLVITTGSGGLAFAVGGDPYARVVVAVHGASGLALLLLAPAKVRIVRRGLRRPGRKRKAASLALAATALLAVGSGLLHAVGGFRSYAGLLPMQVHVGSALVAVALLVAHLRLHRAGGRFRARSAPGSPALGRCSPALHLRADGRFRARSAPGSPALGRCSPALHLRRRSRVRRTHLDRRLALRGAGLVAGAAVLWVVAPGRERRETGSHEVGSGLPAAMPVTQWLFDAVPRIDASTWRLLVPGGALDLAALGALPQRTERAVLDCTGGWWAEQEWRGVALSALGLPGGASVDVISATGYRRRFPARDADALMLATHAGGRALSAGHGGPVRLVAPGRRGFWWVKWVVALEVVDEPWWWQPPFPLQ